MAHAQQVEGRQDETDEAIVERLVRRYDHIDPALSVELSIEVGNRLRDQPGLAHSEAHGGFYVINHYADVLDAQRAAGAVCPVFSYAEGVLQPQNGRPKGIPIDFDEPEHAGYRKLFMNVLNRAAVERFQPVLSEEIDRVLTEFVARGGGNFSTEVARRLPIGVVSRLIGWSQEVSDRADELVVEMMEGLEHEGQPAAQLELLELFQREIDERRRAPRDDYTTELVNAEVNGRPIDDVELAHTLLSFLFGGYESTACVVSNLMLRLVRDQELQDRLRDQPELIGPAIEESIRLNPPAHIQFRTATQDVDVEGTRIPAGSRVAVAWAAANRDPAQFEDPDEFRLDRPNGMRHIGYGFGVHLCAGIHLARAEMLTFFEDLLSRGCRYELDGEIEHGGFTIGHDGGWSVLPIRCTPL